MNIHFFYVSTTFIFLFALLVIMNFPFAADAADPCPRFGIFERPLPGSPPCIDQVIDTRRPLTNYIGLIVNFLTALIVAVGVLMVVVGGYLYMTAGGSADRVQLGKGFIIAALTGIVLALTAWVILATLGPQFVEQREPCIPNIPNACGPGISCPASGRCP
jgi:hypothetical protein